MEIDRIRAACGKRSDLKLECGHTDEGDPWCIVYDRENDEVIVHVARIDRRYLVMKARGARLVTTRSISVAVDAAMAEFFRADDDRRTA